MATNPLKPDSFPPIEYEGSYPEDEDFADFNQVSLSFHRAAAWLVGELPRASENMPCFCVVSKAGDKFVISFSTGGWSGAESIIALIERRLDMAHFMESWRRGGHYVFEIPHRFLTSAADLPGNSHD